MVWYDDQDLWSNKFIEEAEKIFLSVENDENLDQQTKDTFLNNFSQTVDSVRDGVVRLDAISFNIQMAEIINDYLALQAT